MDIKYDLHIHSCLSPCGDDEMTPCNIAGMSYLAKLSLVAVTDHNSCKNSRPFLAACNEYSLTVIFGIEVCSAEDIHLLCYFSNLEALEEFSDIIYNAMPRVKNKPLIYGRQLAMDSSDNIVQEIEQLLIVGCEYSLNKIVDICHEMKGLCFYAHIDKESYSVIAVLGALPQDIAIDGVEIFNLNNYDNLIANGYISQDTPYISNSDAHYLEQIGEKEQTLPKGHPLMSFVPTLP